MLDRIIISFFKVISIEFCPQQIYCILEAIRCLYQERKVANQNSGPLARWWYFYQKYSGVANRTFLAAYDVALAAWIVGQAKKTLVVIFFWHPMTRGPSYSAVGPAYRTHPPTHFAAAKRKRRAVTAPPVGAGVWKQIEKLDR
jgi:hypothetical protein